MDREAKSDNQKKITKPNVGSSPKPPHKRGSTVRSKQTFKPINSLNKKKNTNGL